MSRRWGLISGAVIEESGREGTTVPSVGGGTPHPCDRREGRVLAERQVGWKFW